MTKAIAQANLIERMTPLSRYAQIATTYGRFVTRCAGLVLAIATLSCADTPGATSRANVVVIVDTDAPVPKLASQLRIDFFHDDGSWFESRDVPAASPDAWPVSFGVVLPDGAAASEVVVRLRAYSIGKVRDYRGYRYQARPSGDSPTNVTAPPDATGNPRCIDLNGNDITPATEPLPNLAIDRLLRIPVSADQPGTVSVTLAGACFGTMADLRDFTALATCVDTEAQLEPVTPETIEPGFAPPGPTQQGTFEAPYATPCTGSPRPSGVAPTGAPLHDEDVCVVGGAFVFGSQDGAIGDTSDDAPERVALVPSFYMDRYEVTVARVRAAFQTGLALSVAYNDGPLQGDQDATTMCTFTRGPMGREEMPMNCITVDSARTVCQSIGADLPLEVQWEYAATMSGRPLKTTYPWGDGSDLVPACTDVVYARGTNSLTSDCTNVGVGPAPVLTADHPGGDRSIGLGLVDLAGSMSEAVLDTYASMQTDCWASAPLLLPSCRAGIGPTLTVRGGSWELTVDQLDAAQRAPEGGGSTGSGFRCVRPGAGP
jgi:formylglycine-generating enzyme required for sulfatase activity